MQTVALPRIEVDHSVLLSLKNSADELAEKMKLYTAMTLYRKQQLSLGKAAQMCGMTRLDFIETLKREGVAVFDYDAAQIGEIAADADSLANMMR